jgi:FixJ family two-component response regulator
MRTLQTAENKKPTVVVIDNDDAMRHSLEWLIRSSGHSVLGYESAKSYLGDSARGGRPDCVVLDIHMPEINGLELYGMLKREYPDIAVIFITGYPDQHLAEQARTLEAKGFFTKPLDTDAVLECIDKAVAASGAL